MLPIDSKDHNSFSIRCDDEPMNGDTRVMNLNNAHKIRHVVKVSNDRKSYKFNDMPFCFTRTTVNYSLG